MRKYLLFVLFLLSHVQAEAQLEKVWDQRYGGSSNEFITGVLPLANNNLLLSGRSSSGIGGDKSQASYGEDDYWVVCAAGDGTKLWDAAYGGSDDDVLTTAIATSDGGFLLGGVSTSGISGIKTQASWGFIDYWIVKTDSAGNYQWDMRYGGSSPDELHSIYQTSDGGYILGGASLSDISGDMSDSSRGGYDYWMVKIDSIGTKIWDKRFGGSDNDFCYAVIQTPDDGYLLAGESSSGISGDKSEPSWGFTDYWVVKIDSAGTKVWDKRFGTSHYDLCHSASADGSDGILLGGYTSGGMEGDKTESSWGSSDFWIVHVDGAGNKVWDRRFGGTDSEDNHGNLYRTNDGGYVASGTSSSDISGNKTQDNLGVEQTWMVKFDSAGNYVIDRTLLTTGQEVTGFAAAISEGCFVLVNNTTQDIGGDKSQNSQGGNDYFIAEYCVPGPPEADFYTDTTTCQNQCIQFIDESLYPQTWQWSFPGGTPSSSVLASPVICYSTLGTFDAQLIVTNILGVDTIFYPGYITVNPLPVATIGSFLPVCQLSSPFTLSSGLPLGGTYSGSYVSNGIFTPSAVGSWTITYTYTDSNNCPGSASSIIQVLAIPTVTFNFSPVSFCETDSPVTLNGGDPSGGTYNGIGVSNAVFDPAVAGPGTFTISYTYTNSNGCPNTATTDFTVYEMPDVSLTMDTMVCSEASSFTLIGGLPLGGTYYVDGSLSPVFDPALLGAGYHYVVYKVENNSCIAYDSVNVLITVCTGTGETSLCSLVNLYPNPASDEVILETSLYNTGWSIELYNELGICIKKIPLNNQEGILRVTIDVRTISRGLCWLVLRNDSQRYFKKLVLE